MFTFASNPIIDKLKQMKINVFTFLWSEPLHGNDEQEIAFREWLHDYKNVHHMITNEQNKYFYVTARKVLGLFYFVSYPDMVVREGKCISEQEVREKFKGVSFYKNFDTMVIWNWYQYAVFLSLNEFEQKLVFILRNQYQRMLEDLKKKYVSENLLCSSVIDCWLRGNNVAIEVIEKSLNDNRLLMSLFQKNFNYQVCTYMQFRQMIQCGKGKEFLTLQRAFRGNIITFKQLQHIEKEVFLKGRFEYDFVVIHIETEKKKQEEREQKEKACIQLAVHNMKKVIEQIRRINVNNVYDSYIMHVREQKMRAERISEIHMLLALYFDVIKHRQQLSYYNMFVEEIADLKLLFAFVVGEMTYYVEYESEHYMSEWIAMITIVNTLSLNKKVILAILGYLIVRTKGKAKQELRFLQIFDAYLMNYTDEDGDLDFESIVKELKDF